MAQDSIATALGRLAFMEAFRPEHQEQLAAIATRVRWRADEVIFRLGEHSSAFYVVEEGRVAIELTVPGQGRVTVLTVGPGEIFGWSGLLTERRKVASARAVTATEAFAFDSGRLRALCDADPALGYPFTMQVLRIVIDRVQASRLQFLDIFASPAGNHHGGKP